MREDNVESANTECSDAEICNLSACVFEAQYDVLHGRF